MSNPDHAVSASLHDEIERLRSAMQGVIDAYGDDGWARSEMCRRLAVALGTEQLPRRDALRTATQRAEAAEHAVSRERDEHKSGSLAWKLANRTAERDALQAEVDRLSHLRETLEWKPIASAPKDGTVILVATSDRVWSTSYNFAERGFIGEMEWLGQPRATHWMPLPDPPVDTLSSLGRSAQEDEKKKA